MNYMLLIFIKDVAATTSIDVLLNPIQTMQSRFILQNRLKNFATYRSVGEFLKLHLRNPKSLYQVKIILP